MLIGDVGLATRSMFRNRSGRPSSAVRNAPPPAAAASGPEPGRARQRPAAGRVRERADHGQRAGQSRRAPGRRQVGSFHRVHLEDRAAVVRLELGGRYLQFLAHRGLLATGARPANARATPAASAPAATPAHRHICRQVPGRHDRIRRQPVDLRVVQQQEEGARAADAVVRIGAVQSRARLAAGLQLPQPASGRWRAARPAGRTGSSRSGTPSRRPAPGRRGAGRSTSCTSTPARHPPAGRSPRTGRPKRSTHSRCRYQAGRSRSRTRSAPARRSGTRPGRRRACSACTRRTPSATGWPPGRPRLGSGTALSTSS